jgi:hypothetical protein
VSHEKRIAQNEAFFRDLNERKAEWLSDGLPAAGFRCECWRLDCSDYIRLTKGEWEEVRSEPTHFAVVPGHTASGTAPGVEEVVKRYSHFWIVEKRGEAGRVAEERE